MKKAFLSHPKFLLRQTLGVPTMKNAVKRKPRARGLFFYFLAQSYYRISLGRFWEDKFRIRYTVASIVSGT